MSKIPLDEDVIDAFDQAAVRAYLLDIECKFNKKREQLYYRTQAYFHQSICSDYTKAEDLHELINECEQLKQRYRDFKNFVADTRGTKYVI